MDTAQQIGEVITRAKPGAIDRVSWAIGDSVESYNVGAAGVEAIRLFKSIGRDATTVILSGRAWERVHELYRTPIHVGYAAVPLDEGDA